VKHVRILGMAIVAVLAIAAIAVSSATAASPEWGKCEAQAGGKYEDANCQIKAKGKTGNKLYEWHKGASLKNLPFRGENVGSGGVLTTELIGCAGSEGYSYRTTEKKCEEEGSKYEKEFAVAIECESEHNTGEASGKNGVTNVSVKFLGCKLFGSAPCSNGPTEGEIQINPLKGELGYISKSEHKVGVLLEPKTKHGEFTRFNCAGVLSTVVGVGNTKEGAWYKPENHGGYDEIISPITPVNQMTPTYTQVYTVNHETNENIPSKFEGKHISLLETYTYNAEEPSVSTEWTASGEEITNVNTPTEEGEIKG
jgi:hypothetical protein